MPLIQLLRQPGPLANAPAPVLDRQKRPNVDRRAEVQAVGNLAESAVRKPLDANALTQDLQAMGNVGESIVRAGGVMGALAVKTREAEVDRQVMDKENMAADALGTHANFMAENQRDPKKWQANLEKTWATVQRAIDSDKDLHPESRRQLDQRLSRMAVNSKIGTAAAYQKQTFALAQEGYAAKGTRAIMVRDYEGGEAAMQEAFNKGYIREDQLAAYQNRVKDQKRQDILQDEADVKRQEAARFKVADEAVTAYTRAHGTTEALKELDSNKDYEKLSHTDRQQLRSRAHEVGREMEFTTLSEISDALISGDIKSEADVDAILSKHASAKVRAEAKRMIGKMTKVEMDAAKSGESGIRNSVDLWAEIQQYDGAQDKDGSVFFRLEGAVKAKAQKESEGTLLTELRRRFGVIPPKIAVREPIKDMVSGYIHSTYDAYNGLIPWMSEVEKDGVLVKTMDPDKKKQAIDAMTRIEIQMENWFLANPKEKGNIDAVRQAVIDFMPEGTRAGAYDAINESNQPGAAAAPVSPEPPAGFRQRIGTSYGPGAPGEAGLEGPAGEVATPPAGTRVTSYAYDGEETPDSNSAAGIGAFAPESEQAKIKAGGRSFFKLREGDFAVSPDVEEAMDKAGIDPMDTVIIKFSDGTTQRGRWADRTSDSLRGRWDFYQGGKAEKHGQEGRRVISFQKG